MSLRTCVAILLDLILTEGPHEQFTVQGDWTYGHWCSLFGLDAFMRPTIYLQIGRAYAMQGDTAKARAAYQDFLTLWKDADPDIPILIPAKAEYAKLK